MNRTNDIKYLICCRTIAAIVLFFSLAISPVLAQQDIVMRGAVVLQNSKTLTGQVTYIPDVNISSLKTTPTRSDSRGQFKLVFANMNFGAKTSVSARKTGMMVLNKEVLQEAAIVGRTDTLKVVMCDENQFEVNKQNFYNVSTDNLQRELARRVNKLQRANAVEKRQLMDSIQTEMNIKLTSAEDAIAQLESRSKSLEAQLEKISHDFAAVNLDDASETYRLAYKAFTEGDVKKSLDILNAIDLKKRLQENVVQISQRDTQIGRMQRQNDTSRIQIGQDIQSCLLMANNHRILFQHREAQDWYETAIRFSDTTNLGLLNDYTEYLYEFGEFQKAANFNKITLERARQLRLGADSLRYTEGYTMALYYRVLIYSESGIDATIVKESCFELLSIFNLFFERDSTKNLLKGRVMSSLARAYSLEETTTGDSLSVIWYQNALRVFQQPALPNQQNSWAFFKSFAHLGLGNIYRYMGNYEDSEQASKTAIIIREQLFQKDTIKYAPYLSIAFTMLSATYNDWKKYDTAIYNTRQSLRFLFFSNDRNPLLTQREVMRTQLEMVRSFYGKRLLDTADLLLDSIQSNIDVYQSRYKDEWIVPFLSDYVSVRRLVVIEYLKSNLIAKALTKSLKLNEYLPENKNTTTLYAVALIFNNRYSEAIAVLESMSGDKKKTVKAALHVFERRNVNHPDFNRIKQHFNISN